MLAFLSVHLYVDLPYFILRVRAEARLCRQCIGGIRVSVIQVETLNSIKSIKQTV